MTIRLSRRELDNTNDMRCFTFIIGYLETTSRAQLVVGTIDEKKNIFV